MTRITYYLNYVSHAQGCFWIMSVYDNSKTIWVFLKKKDPLRKSNFLVKGAVINHLFRLPMFTLEGPNSMVHGTWHGWQADGNHPYCNAVLLWFVFMKTWRKTYQTFLEVVRSKLPWIIYCRIVTQVIRLRFQFGVLQLTTIKRMYIRFDLNTRPGIVLSSKGSNRRKEHVYGYQVKSSNSFPSQGSGRKIVWT